MTSTSNGKPENTGVIAGSNAAAVSSGLDPIGDQVVGARAAERQDAIGPVESHFPNSCKVTKGELAVPFREITLTDGTRCEVYDTTGPQGIDPRVGLPKRRQPWVAARAGVARPTQIPDSLGARIRGGRVQPAYEIPRRQLEDVW